jgi:hypothetical protein
MKMNARIVAGFLSLLSLCALSCKKADFGEQVILATGTEVTPIVKFTVQNTPSEYLVTATATAKATQDITVTFALDTAAVSRYNKQNNTTYYAVPDSALSITNLTTVIKAGTSASTPVSVKIISTSPLKDGRSYLVPMSITTVSGGNMTVLESSRTIFLRIARVIGFPAVSMNNATGATTGTPGTRGHFNAAALFDGKNPIQIPNFTLEIKALCYAFRAGDGNTNPQPIQSVVDWGDQEETTTFGLRYGELGTPNNALELTGPLGAAFAYNFNANQWYMLTLAYDGNNLIIYVDGVPAATATGSVVFLFSRMQFGQVWDGYDTKQYFNGRVAETRIWNRCLTASEIKLNLCGADPNANGLIAYWKLNEGSGTIFHNSASTGSKYDMDWTKVYWDPTALGDDALVLADKSQYLIWTNDALNTCSQ